MAVHDHLSELAANVRAGKVDLRQFVVTKGLNKHPKDYPDNKVRGRHGHTYVTRTSPTVFFDTHRFYPCVLRAKRT